MIKRTFSNPMKKVGNRLKNGIQDFKITFKNKSKRKSFILGFTIALGTFGVILFGPALSAVAKDIPKSVQNSTDITPAPAPSTAVAVPAPGPHNSTTGIAGVMLALNTGMFAVGIVCGCAVAVGILHIENYYLKGKK